ncbi:aminomethyl-transferring glycine dehydrogenase subunit GcvPB [Treponema primitia]|uniref:aminomethyl-transferring glycine dehydrogenase subunit GcvPB n=1 Tax=Treponema primitia TaxID=88058 RepID=UPI0002554CA3|nr:aminomethyl-transferring glycine dehydrogenase subunit GcvPB [Treponema primitia]
MKLIFEKSKQGRGCSILPPCDVPEHTVSSRVARKIPAALPSLDENEISRHYSELAKRSFGVNDGFYPLGSCTMKYNPKINEELAGLPGFTDIHPLQPANTIQGCLKVLDIAAAYLREITGMDAMSFQPAAGAHGELTGLLLIKAYHKSRGDTARTKIIIPDSAHGTNPASAAMAGFQVLNIASGSDGCVDLTVLRNAVGPDTAGLMLTNPNTVGIFDPNILDITRIIHEAGGLNYYDGANLNAIMGIVRPGDMGFDAVHLNLHKSFSTPHGGGGPGSGAVGCKQNLVPFLPLAGPGLDGGATESPQSIGRVRAFCGNFLVIVKAAAYLLTLGKENIPEVARNAVLNANYMMERIKTKLPAAYSGPCMHEFVLSLEELKKSHNVSALDFAKAIQDKGMHPPTIYFPLIVHEALMVEPTETESRETLDEAADILISLFNQAQLDPESFNAAPFTTVIGRPDEARAARQPVVRFKV